MGPTVPAMPWWAIVGVIVVLLVLARGLLRKGAEQQARDSKEGE